MDHSVLQYQLRKHMNIDQSYTFAGMRQVYINLMSETEEFKELPVMKEKTFKNNINAWSHSPDGWLVKNGTGESARFFKRQDYVWRCRLSRKKLIAKVADKIRSVKWKW